MIIYNGYFLFLAATCIPGSCVLCDVCRYQEKKKREERKETI
jgi:predicted metal-binding protein